jgi:NTE family protein
VHVTTRVNGVSEPEASRPGAADTTAAPGRPRRGLVLGGGGTLGAAWSIGALCALQEATGWDPRTAETIIGTSAGSILGALLASGVSPTELRDHQRGAPVTTGPLRGLCFDYDTAAGGPLPPAPRLCIGSPSLLRRTVRHPRGYPFQTVLSAFLPTGRGTMDGIGSLLAALGPTCAWPPHPGLWLIAVDYENGERVAFGAPGAPPAGIAEAVLASCAIPSWFAPVVIGGHRYVDGGTWSATSVDLLVGQGLDEVYVLAPMASRYLDRPRSVPARLERRYRRSVTRKMLREARVLRATGTRVRLLVPGPQDLSVMGANMMDPVPRLTVLETSLHTSAAALRAATRPVTA